MAASGSTENVDESMTGLDRSKVRQKLKREAKNRKRNMYPGADKRRQDVSESSSESNSSSSDTGN